MQEIGQLFDLVPPGYDWEIKEESPKHTVYWNEEGTRSLMIDLSEDEISIELAAIDEDGKISEVLDVERYYRES